MQLRTRKVVSNLLIVSVLGVVALIAGFRMMKPEPPPEIPPETPALLVECAVMKPENRDFFTVLHGGVEASLDITVSAKVGGVIQHCELAIGAACGPDQAVVTLDPRDYQYDMDMLTAQVRGQEASLGKAETDFKRMQTLRDNAAVSPMEVDAARLQRDMAEAALQATRASLAKAKKALDDTRIPPPTHGFIVERYVEDGESVQSGMPLFRMIVLDPVKIAVHVSDRDIAQIREQDTVAFSVDAFPDRTFEGVITAVNKSADAGSRTYRVEITAANAGEPRLLPGMVARVPLRIRRFEQHLFLPDSALRFRDGQPHAYVVTSEHVLEERPLVCEEILQSTAVVHGGLRAGDVVVTRGVQILSPGMPVRERLPADDADDHR